MSPPRQKAETDLPQQIKASATISWILHRLTFRVPWQELPLPVPKKIDSNESTNPHHQQKYIFRSEIHSNPMTGWRESHYHTDGQQAMWCLKGHIKRFINAKNGVHPWWSPEKKTVKRKASNRTSMLRLEAFYFYLFCRQDNRLVSFHICSVNNKTASLSSVFGSWDKPFAAFPTASPLLQALTTVQLCRRQGQFRCQRQFRIFKKVSPIMSKHTWPLCTFRFAVCTETPVPLALPTKQTNNYSRIFEKKRKVFPSHCVIFFVLSEVLVPCWERLHVDSRHHP